MTVILDRCCSHPHTYNTTYMLYHIVWGNIIIFSGNIFLRKCFIFVKVGTGWWANKIQDLDTKKTHFFQEISPNLCMIISRIFKYFIRKYTTLFSENVPFFNLQWPLIFSCTKVDIINCGFRHHSSGKESKESC